MKPSERIREITDKRLGSPYRISDELKQKVGAILDYLDEEWAEPKQLTVTMMQEMLAKAEKN